MFPKTSCATYLFSDRKENILFLINDVKTLRATDSKVIGLKFAGSSQFSFWWIRIVLAFFQTSGILPDSQTSSNTAVKYDHRWGQCLNNKIHIWSNGQGQPDDFIFLITFVTSRYVGGLVLYK